MRASVLSQSCLIFRGPMYGGPPGFSVHGILQASGVERVAFSPLRDLPDPGVELLSSVSAVWACSSLPSSHLGFFFFFFNKLYFKMVNMYSEKSFKSQIIYYFESNLTYLVNFSVYMIFKNVSKP